MATEVVMIGRGGGGAKRSGGENVDSAGVGVIGSLPESLSTFSITATVILI